VLVPARTVERTEELTGLPPVLLGMTLSNTGDMQIHPDKKSIMTKGKSGEWSWI